MDPVLGFIIVAIIVLLLCSAFFSGSETALMSVSRPKLHTLEHEGNKSAKRVNRIIGQPEKLLSTILLGNNLVNIGASALATGVFIKLFGEVGMVWATLVMTMLVLIFAEVLPKTIANRWPEKVSFLVSLPIVFLVKFLGPFTWLIGKVTRGFMRLIRINPDDVSEFGREDLKGAISMGLIHDVVDSDKHRMLDSILEIAQLTVEDVMIHRSAVDSISVDLPNEEVLKHIVASPHSRLPVWQENSDNIIGILHVKDYYRGYFDSLEKKEKFDLQPLLNDPYFVPETVKIYDQLTEFKENRRHMALVVDEYGDLQGVVTLEDLLEEIVGEIEDEHDKNSKEFIEENNGAILISGRFPVHQANREFGWSLPEDEDSVTIGGLLTEVAQHIPLVGEKIQIDNLEFRIMAKKRQSIMKVHVSQIGKKKKKKAI
jgi:Mg2+/Co2+ transporter CorB